MLKKKFQDKELVIGTWMSLPSSAVAEIMALSGFDLDESAFLARLSYKRFR